MSNMSNTSTTNTAGFDTNELAVLHSSTINATKPFEDSVYLRIPEQNTSLALRFLPGKEGQKPYHVYQAVKLNGRFYISSRVQQIINGRSQWVAPPNAPDCPVCAYYKAKYAQYNPGKPPLHVEEALRAIKPMVRVSWNVIVRNLHDKKNQGPYVFTCGITVAQKIWSAILGDPATGRKAKGDIFHPKTGRDFLLVKKTKGGSSFPDYSESELLDISEAGTDEEFKLWTSKLHDLREINKPTPLDKLIYEFKVHQGVIKPEGGGSLSEFEVGDEEGCEGVPNPEAYAKSKASIHVQEKMNSNKDDGMEPEAPFMKDLAALDEAENKKK